MLLKLSMVRISGSRNRQLRVRGKERLASFVILTDDGNLFHSCWRSCSGRVSSFFPTSDRSPGWKAKIAKEGLGPPRR
jgi:hypothetical protein